MCKPPPKFCGMRSTTRLALDVDCARLPKMSTARGGAEAFKPRPLFQEWVMRKRRRDYERYYQTDIDRRSHHDYRRACVCGAKVGTGRQVFHHRRNRASDR